MYNVVLSVSELGILYAVLFYFGNLNTTGCPLPKKKKILMALFFLVCEFVFLWFLESLFSVWVIFLVFFVIVLTIMLYCTFRRIGLFWRRKNQQMTQV